MFLNFQLILKAFSAFSIIAFSISMKSSLFSLKFQNRNLLQLPHDISFNKAQREIKDAIFCRVMPDPVKNPKLIAYSTSALQLLGIDTDSLQSSDSKIKIESEELLANYFSGNEIIPGSEPAAHCYCGHQFGNFAGQLGDGAAIYLGEIAANNKKNELQLKGAGKTPFSRTADGRKVLRSSIREFLCSEYMHSLNIPTTRAGTCVTSESTVERDPLYQGEIIDEQCTVVSRIAENFFRFGSFEIFKIGDENTRSGPSAGNDALKLQLLTHIMDYYPSNIYENAHSLDEKYEAWFREVVRLTAVLVAKWMNVGFIHGVLNTDNMSVMGLTIDYGPYAFMESFDPDFISNGSDDSARYCYSNQKEICKWNLMKLAEVLECIIPLKRSILHIEEIYDCSFEIEFNTLMRDRLGLHALNTEDSTLIKDLFETMQSTHADFSDTFQALTLYNEELQDNVDSHDECLNRLINRLVSRCANPKALTESLKRKIRIQKLTMPPQNIQHFWNILQDPAQTAANFEADMLEMVRFQISKEKRKLDGIMTAASNIDIFQNMNDTEKQIKDKVAWTTWVNMYISRLQSDQMFSNQERIAVMRKANPTFVLRNWMMQEAIDAASFPKNDYSRVKTLLEMCTHPFRREYCSFLHDSSVQNISMNFQHGEEFFCRGSTPQWAPGLICTCSS